MARLIAVRHLESWLDLLAVHLPLPIMNHDGEGYRHLGIGGPTGSTATVHGPTQGVLNGVPAQGGIVHSVPLPSAITRSTSPHTQPFPHPWYVMRSCTGNQR